MVNLAKTRTMLKNIFHYLYVSEMLHREVYNGKVCYTREALIPSFPGGLPFDYDTEQRKESHRLKA